MFLGIDTSNYTTSLAVIDKNREVYEDNRIILPVPTGQKGLQQSTALFYHVKNLPELTKEVFKNIKGADLQAVAASVSPRPYEDSYMPVFTVGAGLAESISNILGIPFLKTTHQEGHLAAGLWSIKREDMERFLVVHLSGGTTELLEVKRRRVKELLYEIRILGCSSDISAGQLIDRVGIAMGLPFPCGPTLEKLAAQNSNMNNAGDIDVIIPSSVKDYIISFSGAETKAKSYLAKGVPGPLIARAIENCITTALEKVLRKAIEETEVKDVVLVGGVAANTYLRQRLRQRLEHRAIGGRLYFPEARYCSDNAVGIGLIAHSMIY
ncbi:MAG: O-sialoglycoprotein endopeptidase [Firmicutes bacterium HGW-Firmicutes-12]|nr:MAG: O-sialoglycoprotein endopeptidase [Firmicutes bacterium HGW-Firmicutes-12]